ncbi:hypothetical protein [uncultured Hoeflea sp.]|uniref:hypothetical protein n=1 Tax=uncultured Hoeflea sp. TaxID=538666 RepID=UPI0026382F41|nr:hypothetical protein [uncultured Hoeflea sp.]
MTKRTKRRTHLTTAEKANYQAAAEQFKQDIQPLFCSLKAFGHGYKSLHAIMEAIDNAYGALDVHKPDKTIGR